MPTFNVQMFEGRTVEQKRNFVAEVTRVTCETLGCSPGSVDIIITDVKKEDWAPEGSYGVMQIKHEPQYVNQALAQLDIPYQIVA